MMSKVTGLPNPSRETKFSSANGDREMSISPVQLTTSRIGNLTRLILTLAICDDHTHIQPLTAHTANYKQHIQLVTSMVLGESRGAKLAPRLEIKTKHAYCKTSRTAGV